MLHRFLRVIVVSLALLVSCGALCSAEAQGKNEEVIITVTGNAVYEPDKAIAKSQGIGFARQAAWLDGCRNLAEMISGVEASSPELDLKSTDVATAYMTEASSACLRLAPIKIDNEKILPENGG